MAAILDFEAKESLKVKNSYLNEFLIPKLVKNDLLFVKIAPQIKKLKFLVSDGCHFEKRLFLRLSTKNLEGHYRLFSKASSNVPKTTNKHFYIKNGHRIIVYDQTIGKLGTNKSTEKGKNRDVGHTLKIWLAQFFFDWKCKQRVLGCQKHMHG